MIPLSSSNNTIIIIKLKKKNETIKFLKKFKLTFNNSINSRMLYRYFKAILCYTDNKARAREQDKRKYFRECIQPL